MHDDQPAATAEVKEPEGATSGDAGFDRPQEEVRGGGSQYTPTTRVNERPPPNGLNHSETVLRVGAR